METKELVEIGLTKNQAEIYLELIKNPEQTAGKIAKKLSLDRSFTYGILTTLTNKGLVSYVTKENKRYFYASDPKNLLKEIEEAHSKISRIIKELNTLKQPPKQERLVNVYEGKAGLKAYIRDFLSSENFFTLGGGGKLSIFEKLRFEFPHYLKELKKKKASGQIITSAQNLPAMKDFFKDSNVQIKSLKNLKTEVNFTIFKNKIAIYSAEENPFVIIIQDKNISLALKTYFNNLWKIAKP